MARRFDDPVNQVANQTWSCFVSNLNLRAGQLLLFAMQSAECWGDCMHLISYRISYECKFHCCFADLAKIREITSQIIAWNLPAVEAITPGFRLPHAARCWILMMMQRVRHVSSLRESDIQGVVMSLQHLSPEISDNASCFNRLASLKHLNDLRQLPGSAHLAHLDQLTQRRLLSFQVCRKASPSLTSSQKKSISACHFGLPWFWSMLFKV